MENSIQPQIQLHGRSRESDSSCRRKAPACGAGWWSPLPETSLLPHCLGASLQMTLLLLTLPFLDVSRNFTGTEDIVFVLLSQDQSLA